MLGLKPRDHIGQGFDDRVHPPGVGVQHALGVQHDPDMTGEKHNVAAFQDRIIGQWRTNAVTLQVGIARHAHSCLSQRELHQA